MPFRARRFPAEPRRSGRIEADLELTEFPQSGAPATSVSRVAEVESPRGPALRVTPANHGRKQTAFLLVLLVLLTAFMIWIPIAMWENEGPVTSLAVAGIYLPMIAAVLWALWQLPATWLFDADGIHMRAALRWRRVRWEDVRRLRLYRGPTTRAGPKRELHFLDATGLSLAYLPYATMGIRSRRSASADFAALRTIAADCYRRGWISRLGSGVDDPADPAMLGEGEGLIQAARHDSLPVLEELIARGVPVNARADDGTTALHHAAGTGSVGAVDVLLRAGADIDCRTGQGLTPYWLAMIAGHDHAANRLREAGADTELPAPAGNTRYGIRCWWPIAVTLFWVAWWSLASLVVVYAAVPEVEPAHAVIPAGVAVLGLYLARRRLFGSAVPVSQQGGVLTLGRLLGRRITVDLDQVVAAARSWPNGIEDDPPVSTLFLVVPQHAVTGTAGVALTSRQLGRRVPRSERENLRKHGERAVSVLLDRKVEDDLLRNVVPRLFARKVGLTKQLFGRWTRVGRRPSVDAEGDQLAAASTRPP